MVWRRRKSPAPPVRRWPSCSRRGTTPRAPCPPARSSGARPSSRSRPTPRSSAARRCEEQRVDEPQLMMSSAPSRAEMDDLREQSARPRRDPRSPSIDPRGAGEGGRRRAAGPGGERVRTGRTDARRRAVRRPRRRRELAPAEERRVSSTSPRRVHPTRSREATGRRRDGGGRDALTDVGDELDDPEDDDPVPSWSTNPSRPPRRPAARACGPR